MTSSTASAKAFTSAKKCAAAANCVPSPTKAKWAAPFNILFWRNEPIMIDFPQSVDPRENPRSFELLSRDLENVWRFCQKFSPQSDPWKLAAKLWSRFLRAEL